MAEKIYALVVIGLILIPVIGVLIGLCKARRL